MSRKIAVPVAIALGVLAGGGAAGFAASSQTPSGAAQATTDPVATEALKASPHRDVSTPDGRVERLQFGQLTELTAATLTVMSKDGYTSTYRFDATTGFGDGKPRPGETVTVLATVTDGQATATAVVGGDQPALPATGYLGAQGFGA